jgi:hypothetical protein
MSVADKMRGDLLAQIAAVGRDLTLFSDPSAEHRKAKATFWSHFLDGETPVPEPIDLAAARRFCGDRRIENWWSLPGFVDWFTNREEFRQRVEFISNLALDNLEQVLRDKDTGATARIAAIKLVMELGNKLPKAAGKEAQYADEKIAGMSKEQLEEYIQKNIRKLPVAK